MITSSMTLQLCAEDLHCRRAGQTVFSGIGFSLASGGGLTVTGPNGAGKSTLLRCTAGLLPPAGGAVRLTGCNRPRRHAIHLLTDNDALKDSLRVGEILTLWSRLLGGSRRDADHARDQFDLKPLTDMPAVWLSRGQRRRLALARLLAAPRPIWLLDEPAASLDESARDRLIAAVSHHRRQGGMVITAVPGITPDGMIRIQPESEPVAP